MHFIVEPPATMHPDFQLPSQMTIHGRSSSITASFFTSLTPVIEPSETDVEEALKVLGMFRGHCVCAYCGAAKSEWDHFRPIVEKQLPTGFITEIANLVPSCGKCNQSKGNKHWKQWMLGLAKGSPKSRGVSDLAERVSRLEAYENWRKPVQLNYAAIVELAGSLNFHVRSPEARCPTSHHDRFPSATTVNSADSDSR
jgi:hypothetical protein